MAEFKLTDENGVSYKVTAETQEQALAAFKKMTSGMTEEKESVLSRFWTSVTGSDADPTVANMASANLGLPPAKAAEMTALLATTRSPDRLRSGIARIEPEAEFSEDEAGRLIAVLPLYRGGEKTGQFTRVYPNEPGLGLTEGLQASGAVAAATPIGRGLRALGITTTGVKGAAAIGATEAGLVEAASSQLSGAPFQITDVPLGAAGGVAGEKLFNLVGSLANIARRSGPESVLGPDGRLLPGPAKMAQDAGLNPDEVSANVAAEIQKQVRRGVEPEAAGARAMSTGLPVEVPMTAGQISGSKGQQLAEDAMASGVMGRSAEQQMQTFQRGQQEALRENIGELTERLAPGATPIAKGEGGALAQEALVAARSGDKARADDLYRQARASGSAVLEPDEALDFAEAARVSYREGFTPATAPKMDALLTDLDEIMLNGGDIKSLQSWRTRVSNLRKGAPDTEGAAATSVLRMFDKRLSDAIDNELVIGDQAAIDVWQQAVKNWGQYKSKWDSKGGMLGILTEEVGGGTARRLKIAPESAANAIFTSTASGLSKKTNLARDLLDLKKNLPTPEWNALRQEAFIRLAKEAEGVFREGEQVVSGVKFKKAWENLKSENPGVVNNLFSKEEKDLITQFSNVAARATNNAVNASNSSNQAMGLIQKLAATFSASGPGRAVMNNIAANLIREPYGAMRAAQSTAQRAAPRQATPAAVGAGTGAVLSQEEELGSRIPITGRMTVGGQQ